MGEFFRFAAFISYCSKDVAFAIRLHRALERYAIPTAIGRFDIIGDGLPNRIYPVFRDRDELAAGPLGERIESALRASANLIVVCSPAAAASPWVDKEIRYFAGLGRRQKIFAIIVDDAPLEDASGGDVTASNFPAAFRISVLNDADALEPLAADARPTKDGFRNAWLKLVAGIIGVNAGTLNDRDRQRRTRRFRATFAATATASLLLAALLGTVATTAERNELQGLARAAAESPHSHEAATLAVAALPPDKSLLPSVSSEAREAVSAAGLGICLKALLGQGTDVEVSADGKRILYRDLDGKFWDYHSTPGAAAKLSGLGSLRVAKLTDDGHWIVAQDWDGRLLAFGIDGAQRELGRMAIATTFEMHAGRVLVAADALGDVRLFDPAGSREARLQLEKSHYKVSVSRNGTAAIVQDREYRLHHVDMESGKSIVVATAPKNWEWSADGRLLFAAGNDGLLLPLDARTGERLAIDPASQVAFDAHGEVAILTRETGVDILRTDGRLLARFHPEASVTFAYSRSALRLIQGERTSIFVGATEATAEALANAGSWRDVSSFLATAETDAHAPGRQHLLFRITKSSSAIAVMNLDDGVVTDLGAHGSLDPYFPFVVGHNGARLILRSNVGHRGILEVGQQNFRRLLKHQGEARHSADLDVIVLASPDLVLSVWGETASVGDADISAAAICTASPGIAPLTPQQRASHSSLVGRPWHPCDWRGLAAVFPDRERGDGWFEGPYQLLRRIGVLYLGTRDYNCGESLQNAGDARRAHLRQGCTAAKARKVLGISK